MSHNIESNSTNAATSPSMQEEGVRINSVSEFIEKIVQLDKEEGAEIFYRGHADRDWELLPSIFRTPNGIENEHLLFRDMVARLPQSFSDCKSALDYLVQMQHYGLPTRLLDVTTNSLVALYFACEEVCNIGSEAMKAGSGEAFRAILSSPKPWDTKYLNNNFNMVDALSALVATLVATVNKGQEADQAMANLVIDDIGKAIVSKDPTAGKAVTHAIKEGKKAGKKIGSKDGVVYLFSIPEDSLKHYDSDTVSVLANLAKCNDKEIDICTKQTKDEGKGKELRVFNKQAGIRKLLHQIKEEKPYFRPLIDSHDLSSIFLIKAKYGNPRIVNQAGAFFLFGLGITLAPFTPGGQSLTKGGRIGIPSTWIKHKFIVPKDKKKKILEELANLGITESYIYPEIDKYAKELKKRYNL